MKCDLCNKEVILVPSAAERARKYQHLDGHPASFYTKLFPRHAQCIINKRNAEVSALILRLNKEKLDLLK